MDKIKIEKVEALQLSPGDVLLVHVGQDVTSADASDVLASIGEQLEAAVPADVKVIVVCGDIEFLRATFVDGEIKVKE